MKTVKTIKNKVLSIKLKSTGLILNPWYQLDPSQTTFHEPKYGGIDQTPNLINYSCIELPNYDFNLFFNADYVIFENKTGSISSNYLINPLKYYITYKTFINYNIIYPALDEIDYSKFNKVNKLIFNIGQTVRIDDEKKVNDKIIKSYYHEIQPYKCELPFEDITNYLHVLNKTLYYAIAFYLIGCENPRYFLVEFYKAVESIKKSFENEKAFILALKDCGITESDYKKFTKNCNDVRNSPLDIGRHAPDPRANLYNIDIRKIFVDPLTTDVFSFSTEFCRAVIDSYLKYLLNMPANFRINVN